MGSQHRRRGTRVRLIEADSSESVVGEGDTKGLAAGVAAVTRTTANVSPVTRATARPNRIVQRNDPLTVGPREV